MLTYLDYSLHSLRGNCALCGHTNTSLPVKTVTTNMVRKTHDKIVLESLGHRIFDMPIRPPSDFKNLFSLTHNNSLESGFVDNSSS